MMNTDHKQMILDRLEGDSATALTMDDLNQMLEEELAKPPEQIDTALVDDLLDLLNAPQPTDAEQEAAWQQIEKELQGKKRPHSSRVSTALRRIVAVAAILVAGFFLSLGTAQAFKWTNLLKFLEPLAETFGIYSDNTQPKESAFTNAAVYTDEETGIVQQQYTAQDVLPEDYQDYRVLPVWLPERFSFLQGSIYDDGQAAVITAVYLGGEDLFNLTTTVFASEEDVSSYWYEYEKSWQDPVSRSINSLPVTFYKNSNTNRGAASWIFNNAHYIAIGNVTEAELEQIVSTIIEVQKGLFP